MITSRIVISFFVVIFGISSWATVSGIFIQLPLYAERLPESWSIGTDLGLVIQVSNLFPLLVLALWKIFPSWKNYQNAALILLFFGVGFTGLYAIFWNKTAYVFGEERSVGLLTLTFFSGAVDCTSSIIYFPLIQSIQVDYMSPLIAGESLSGAVAALFSLIQAALNLNVEYYYMSLTFMMFFSLLCLVFLITLTDVWDFQRNMTESLVEKNAPKTVEIIGYNPVIRLFIIFLINFCQNGLLTSLVTYSFKTYENHDTLMKVAITTSYFINPLVSFLPLNGKIKSIFENPVTHSPVWLISCTYILVLCIVRKHLLGGVFLTILYIIGAAFLSFSKAMIFTQLKVCRNGLKWTEYAGITTQVGSAVGSLFFFLMIHYTTLFGK